MNKLAIVYWSGTGNTETMANCIADGARESGAEVAMLSPGEFSATRFSEFGVDGLTGFPEAISAVYLKTEVQQCIIHQIRNSTKYVSYKDIKALMADLKKVYAAVDEETAIYELERFADKWDSKYPKISASWKAHWSELSTYFKYPQSVRTLIYTTNSIENFNRQLRKVSKNRSVFPNDDSLLKMLYLAQVDITRKWTGRRRDQSEIHSQLEIFFADRLPE